MTAIRLDGLTIRHGHDVVIEDVNLNLERSSRTALLGASGSGKTSLLRAIAGFMDPQKGRVWLFEQNVTGIPPEDRNISMLFQEPVLFPRLTIRENAQVAMGNVRSAAAASRIESLAREFMIDSKLLDRRIDSGLSGGERQRAALIRAFSNKQEILLLDEPLRGALNVELKWQLLHAIRKRISEDGITTLVVTHDFVEAAYLADKIVVLHDAAVAVGEPHEIYNFPPNIGVALVLGPGNVVPADVLTNIRTRDGQFPLIIDNEISTVNIDTDMLFFRPEKLSVQASNEGFTVVDDRFLGNIRRIRLKAPNEQEIEAHVPPEMPALKSASVSIKAQDVVVFDPLWCRRAR